MAKKRKSKVKVVKVRKPAVSKPKKFKKKVIRKRAPSLMQQLVEALKEAKLGIIDQDHSSDDSGAWIDIKVGEKQHLTIDFDITGTKIESIGLFEDVVEVVNQEKIFQIERKD